MGGMAKSISKFYCHLDLKLSIKRDEHLSVTLGLLCCHLSFTLLQSAIMCIRGVCSSRHKPLLNSPFDLQVAESRLSFCSLLTIIIVVIITKFTIVAFYCYCYHCCIIIIVIIISIVIIIFIILF